jgi:hypothetical protein
MVQIITVSKNAVPRIASLHEPHRIAFHDGLELSLSFFVIITVVGWFSAHVKYLTKQTNEYVFIATLFI